MKVTFLVSHLLSGGAERTVSYVASHLAQNGWDVTVLSISDDIFYTLDDRVRLVTLSVPSKSSNTYTKFKNIWKRFYRVRSFLKKNEPDVLFCMLPETAKYVVKPYNGFKFKLITSERNNPAYENPKTQSFKHKLFATCDGIIFQTQRAKDYYFNVIGDKGIVIHNAVGNELVYKAPEVVERKNKISAVGRCAEQKDYKTLLSAFSIVNGKYSDFTLEIFGNNDSIYAEEMKKLAFDLGIGERVKFMGVAKDAVLKIADSSVYVMSSRFEGMPNALMEAMAAGLPCISTDCPNGPAELIENGVNGLLVPVGDADALAVAIIKMIEDRIFAEQCGKNARKILETHSIDQKAKEYAEYIEKVLNTK